MFLEAFFIVLRIVTCCTAALTVLLVATELTGHDQQRELHSTSSLVFEDVNCVGNVVGGISGIKLYN